MKNLFTLFTLLFFSVALCGQPPSQNGSSSSQNGSSSSEKGQPLVINDSEVGGGNGNARKTCVPPGRAILNVNISLPFPLPTNLIFNTGHPSTSMGLIYPLPLADRESLNGCNQYQYSFSIMSNFPIVGCGQPTKKTLVFGLYVGNQCFYDYFDSLGYYDNYSCLQHGCQDFEIDVTICDTCGDDRIPDDEIDLEGRSIHNSSAKVWPNPFNNSISFDSNLEIKEVEILSFSGKLIKTKISVQEGISLIDTRELASGIYMLKVMYLNGSYDTVKVIKQ